MRWERTTATIILAIVCLLAMTGCSTARQVVQQKETAKNNLQTNVSRTDTVIQHDTISVRQSSRTEVTARDTMIQVELPQMQIERQTQDTTSVIDTPYFTSKATWSGGKLTQTFKTKTGASIQSKVMVTDTFKEQSTTTERTSNTKEVSKRDSSTTVSSTDTKLVMQTPNTRQEHHSKTCGWLRTLKRKAIAAVVILLCIAIVAALLYFTKGSAFFKRKS